MPNIDRVVRDRFVGTQDDNPRYQMPEWGVERSTWAQRVWALLCLDAMHRSDILDPVGRRSGPDAHGGPQLASLFEHADPNAVRGRVR